MRVALLPLLLVVVGLPLAAGRASAAVSYGSGVAITDPASPGALLLPTGVNASGVVSGFDTSAAPSQQNSHSLDVPVAWQNGVASPLPLLPPQQDQTQQDYYDCATQDGASVPLGISDTGTIAGMVATCDVWRHSDIAVWTGGAGSWALTPRVSGRAAVMSPNGTAAGYVAADTGTTDQGVEVYTCGPFVGDPLTALPSPAKACYSPVAGTAYNGEPFAVNDAGAVLTLVNNGEDFQVTGGAVLPNYCHIYQDAPENHSFGQFLSDTGLVIGRDCCGGGAVWNAATGAETLLQPLVAGDGTGGHAISPQGLIFGSSGNKAVVWTSPTAVPQVLAGVVGYPVFVSNNATYLVTTGTSQTNQAGKSYQLYKSGQTSTLTVSVVLPTGPNNGGSEPNLNDTVPVTVTVSAPGTGSGSFTNLAFTGSPLQWDPSASLQLVDGPSPAVPGSWSIPVGGSITFTFHVKVVALGTIDLTSTVTGQDPDGQPVNASGSTSLAANGGLVTTVTADVNPVQLDADANGDPIPKPVTITVTIDNPLSVDVTNVTIPHDLAVQWDAAHETAAPVKQVGDPAPGTNVGTIPAGDQAVVTIPFQAVGDGNATLVETVTYANPTAAGNLISIGSLIEKVDPKVLLTFDYHAVGDGTALVRAGDTFSVVGLLHNVSNADVVHVDPLLPTLTGNVGGGNPVDADNPPLPADVFPLPWSGALGQGDTKTVQALAQTVPEFGTHATVGYTVTGTVDLPDGTSRPLVPADIESNPAPVSVGIDDSPPTVAATPVTATSVIGHFGLAAVLAAEQWTQNNLQTAAWLVKTAGKVSLDFTLNPPVIRLMQTVDYYVTYLAYLTPQARDDWFAHVAAGILTQTVQFGTTVGEVKQKIADAVVGWGDGLTHAWKSGDWNTVADYAGQVGGNALLEAATWYLTSAKGVEAVAAGEAAAEAGDAAKVAQTVTSLVEGEDLLAKAGAPLRTIFGMSDEQVAQLVSFAREKSLQIAIRFRNPKSLEWIEKFKAVVKPEAVKLKTVADLDWRFLGYRKADEALCVLKQPISKAEVAANLAKQQVTDPAIIKAVLARYQQRAKEYAELLPVYQKYAKNGVDIGFDYGGQGILHQPSVFTRRAFALTRPHGAPTGEYFLLELADTKGTLRWITGDLDAVAVTKADGSMLNEAERLDAYEALQQINDAQHGATFDWFKDAELASSTQLKLLSAHYPGGEPLAVFDPAGRVTAQYIDPAYSFFNKNKQLGRIWYTKGYRVPDPQPYPMGPITIPKVPDPFNGEQPWLSPTSWGLKNPKGVPAGGVAAHIRTVLTDLTRLLAQAGAAKRVPVSPPVPTLAHCSWHYSNAAIAGVVYPDEKGGLRQWTPAHGWRALDTRECTPAGPVHASGPLGADRVLSLLPQTSLATAATAGSRILVINGVAAAAPGLNPRTTAWFRVGQRIVVGPGTTSQESATIARLTPLTLTAPLHRAHGLGELVSATPRKVRKPALAR